MKSRTPLLVVALAAVAAACGEDPFAVRASLQVVTDTFVVYALNGTDPHLPAGINTPFNAPARVDSTFNFDFALDIDAAGDVVVLPVGKVGTNFGSSRRVSFATPDVPFDSIRRAPDSGYVTDTIITVETGTPVVVQAVTPVCQGSTVASPIIYSKFVVDSIDAATRALYVRSVVDPNCGFLSFLPGVPSN